MPPKFGAIAGRVVQGAGSERPQPGLPVQLLDATGKVIGAATTNTAGEFEFPDLLPGPYFVGSVKVADYGARSVQAVSVEAGETTAVTLDLKR